MYAFLSKHIHVCNTMEISDSKFSKLLEQLLMSCFQSTIYSNTLPSNERSASCQIFCYTGPGPGLASLGEGFLLLRHVHWLLHRLCLGRLLPALRGSHLVVPVHHVHCTHDLQSQAHGVDGHLAMSMVMPPKIKKFK